MISGRSRPYTHIRPYVHVPSKNLDKNFYFLKKHLCNDFRNVASIYAHTPVRTCTV